MLGVEPTSHQALQQLFSRDLVKPGHFTKDHSRMLASLQGLRHQADYNRDFEFDLAGVQSEVAKAKELFVAIEAFLVARGVTLDVR